MRLLIADGHELVLQMLASFLRADLGVCADTARTLAEATELVARHAYDAVLLDYSMPGMDGLSGLAEMLAISPGLPVALVSGSAGEGVARRALAAGAAGFLPKTMSPADLSSAVRRIVSGATYVPPGLSGRSAETRRLTRREQQVLERLTVGKSNKEIARDLDLAEVTIKLHVRTLYRKIGAANRTQAAVIARQEGLA